MRGPIRGDEGDDGGSRVQDNVVMHAWRSGPMDGSQ